jgi:hypothetical protein
LARGDFSGREVFDGTTDPASQSVGRVVQCTSKQPLDGAVDRGQRGRAMGLSQDRRATTMPTGQQHHNAQAERHQGQHGTRDVAVEEQPLAKPFARDAKAHPSGADADRLRLDRCSGGRAGFG